MSWGDSTEKQEVGSTRGILHEELSGMVDREWLAGKAPLCLVLCPSPGTSTEGVGAALPLPSSHGKRRDRAGETA